MNPFDLNLIWYGPLVRALEAGLRAIAAPLADVMHPGLAGGLAIILFTIVIRLVLLPLSLAQVRSQKAMMAVQPAMKELQRKFKNDREGLARAQMALYKERGINPAAGCLPLLVQMPILFGMYSAMLTLSTEGLTLDQVANRAVDPAAGRVVYEATRAEEPLPSNQFVLARLAVVPRAPGAPIPLEVVQDTSALSLQQANLLAGAQGLVLTPGQPVAGPNIPNPPGGQAAIFLRPAGVLSPDGTFDRNVPVQVGQPYLVEVMVNAPQKRVDAARAVIAFDPALLNVVDVQIPEVKDVAFKSSFLWLPSLGEPDIFPIAGLPIPGLLLLLMTLTTFLTQRMTTMPTTDPQQQAMMRMMTFMPLMYLFFFLTVPAGLVLYWLVSNFFTMLQQYFTTGLGMLGGDIQRFTGRDLQPAWAHYPAVTGPTPAGANGRANGAAAEDLQETDTTPARTGSAAARRPRPAGGKGRKRGKR